MIRLIFAILLLNLAFAAQAVTQIKVKKIKDQKAVIEFEGPLDEGQIYTLQTPSQSSPAGTVSRKFRLGITGDLNALTTKADTFDSSSSLFGISVDFGWNYGESEMGWVLGYTTSREDAAGATSVITVGGFYDRNFTRNKDPENSIFGWSARLTLQAISEGGGAPLNRTNIYLNLFWKYFLISNAAVRGDIGYYCDQGKESLSTNSTTSGPKATLGLALYY
jgi:hypothetical protein